MSFYLKSPCEFPLTLCKHFALNQLLPLICTSVSPQKEVQQVSFGLLLSQILQTVIPLRHTVSVESVNVERTVQGLSFRNIVRIDCSTVQLVKKQTNKKLLKLKI